MIHNIYIYIYILYIQYIIYYIRLTLPGINNTSERDEEIERLLLMMTLKEFTNIKSANLRFLNVKTLTSLDAELHPCSRQYF